MDQLGDLIKTGWWGCCGLLALFIILLALPQSRLRYYVLRGLGIVFFTFTGLLALYIVSPLDALPDVIPLLGQIDDGGALISAIVTGLSGALAWWKSKTSKTHHAGSVGRPPQLPPGS